jgi:hypothetical protein
MRKTAGYDCGRKMSHISGNGQTNLQGVGKSSSPNALGIFACNVYFINLARKEKMFKGYTYYENFFGKHYKLIYTTTVN